MITGHTPLEIVAVTNNQLLLGHAMKFTIPIFALAFIAVCFLMFRPAIERALSPGFGCCLKCNRPWRFVDGHNTQYSAGRFCFPLCESCWSEMEPEERLPYYRELWIEWKRWDDMGGRESIDWEVIRDACINEGEIEFSSQSVPQAGVCLCGHGLLSHSIISDTFHCMVPECRCRTYTPKKKIQRELMEKAILPAGGTSMICGQSGGQNHD